MIGTNNNNTNYKIRLRNKRDLTSFSDNDNIKPRRRVVKKLIRVQPITEIASVKAATNKLDSTIRPPTRKRRRRLKIKKKKKRLLANNTNINNLNNISEEQLQQATKPRRKIVITRKRLLPKSNKTAELLPTKSLNGILETTASESSIDENKTEDNINEISNESTTDFTIPVEKSSENYVEGQLENASSEEKREDSISEEEEDNESNEEEEVDDEYYENNVAINEEEEDSATNNPNFQDLPEYEPFFPELSESLDAPVLLLKTTVLSSIELETKTITTTRLRTYTFVVTRATGSEQIITSTTEVKPQVKTSTITESLTKLTTLTLLDFDATNSLTDLPQTFLPSLDITPTTSSLVNQEETGREEARYNLATRVMSNGVEVIVAGDKTTLPGEPDVKRILPSTYYKPVTLKPSTLSDHMMMMLPQETTSDVEDFAASLYPNQFVTKTCLTTFTYLTTYLEGGATTVSSHEQVVSNIATEERNTGKILPTPAMGITLTQYPNLSVGVFHTTYTYLNTILDGEQPLVISSKHIVTNTVTAPDDYLSLLKPSETVSALKDTNTYYSTIPLEKTLYEDGSTSVISTREVVTQVVITESIPPRGTSVMTSYIALDDKNDNNLVSSSDVSTTDVVKTYFVTYTYYNTMIENGQPVVKTNVSTESDVVTEKLYLHPKKTALPFKADKKKHKIDSSSDEFNILATKTYFTTFTYFTTILQEENPESPTVIISSTNVIENIVTETLDPNIFDKQYVSVLKDELMKGTGNVKKTATLQDGQKIEITATSNNAAHVDIIPTKVLPIERTKLPESDLQTQFSLSSSSTSSPNIITGSTIVYIDDDPFANLFPTPTLSTKSTKISEKSTNIVNLGSLLSSEIVKETNIAVSTSKVKRTNKTKSKNKQSISPSKTVAAIQSKKSDKPKVHHVSDKNDKKKQHNSNKIVKQPVSPATDLLGLGSINMNTLQALTPVLSAMAGLINQNLKSNRRNDINLTLSSTPSSVEVAHLGGHKDESQYVVPPAVDVQNRSPVYIPVGGALGDDFEIAESQNIASFDWIEPPSNGKLPQEASLLNGGIPISPGDVITANSDVIIGKTGRIGPRLPSIPLNNGPVPEEEFTVDMKPPPPPHQDKRIRKQPHDFKLPVAVKNERPLANVVHTPHKDDYVGPPPPITPPKNEHYLRGEVRKQGPIPSPNKQFKSPVNGYEEHFYSHVNHESYVENQPNYRVPLTHPKESPQNYHHYTSNEVNPDKDLLNLKEPMQKNYDTAAQNSYPPIYPQSQESPMIVHGSLLSSFNIEPSVSFVLPEVVERSTGQPLLVQLQPSQVAFVNIPFNRTTALIYGGSTEPHKNGQYFDDPSPYPDPEYSVVENYHNGVPKHTSVYQGLSHADQKQVTGVIKVGTQLINVEPDTSANKKVPNIQPSKTTNQGRNELVVGVGNNHEINVNVPPLSFGTVQQENDFHRNIINQTYIQFRPPPQAYDVYKENGIPQRPDVHLNLPQYTLPTFDNNRNEVKKEPTFSVQNHYEYVHNFASSQEQHTPPNVLKPQSHQNTPPNIVKQQSHQNTNIVKPQGQQNSPTSIVKPQNQHKPKYPPVPNKYNRNRPRPEPSGYMTPPPVNKISFSNLPYYGQQRPVHRPQNVKRPLPIPIGTENVYQPQNQHVSNNLGQPGPHNINEIQKGYLLPFESHRIESNNNQHNIRYPANNFANKYNNNIIRDQPAISDIDESDLQDDDDLATEDGEVIQESNSRPLKPGEVPYEILKSKISTTTEHPTSTQGNPIRFPSVEPVNIVRFPENSIIHNVPYPQPVHISHEAKPFITTQSQNAYIPLEMPVVRPENQQTNQIVSFDVLNSQNGKHQPIRFNQYTTIKPEVSIQTGENIQYPNKLFDVKYTTPKPIRQQKPVTVRTPIKQNPIDLGIAQGNSDFGIKTKTTNAPATTSQKPVIIYIDKDGQTNNFFKKNKNNRPKVTSLPIDVETSHTSTTTERVTIQSGSQTEKLFVIPQHNPSQPTNKINIQFSEADVTKAPIPPKVYTKPQVLTTTTFKPTTTTDPIPLTPHLNTGETTLINDNLASQIKDMEIMKPPPLDINPSTEPQFDMHPPKINVNSPGSILKVPPIHMESVYDLEAHGSSPKPYVPKPLEEMVPPPESTTEIVLGMSPPPLVSTHKPIISNKPITTIKPVFSMEIDIPKETTRLPETPHRYTRPRYPFTRRPGYRRTTTTVAPNAEVSTRFRYPIYQNISQTSTTTKKYVDDYSSVTTDSTISPTPTIKAKPSLEVIIGNPNSNLDESSKGNTHIVESEVPVVTPSIKEPEDPPTISHLDFTTSSHREQILNTPVHHAGNEIKIVDETTTPLIILPSFTKEIVQSSNIKTPVLPTRYITHTKTLTVTITKTTVVKTLGGPPSTLTLLVTKTEMSTIVDTVTEFHTLVKPTSIVETITTTVQQGSSLYPPEVYTSNYPSVQVRPSSVLPSVVLPTETSNIIIEEDDDSLEDFIINETDPPRTNQDADNDAYSGESIFVVMTDKNKGGVIKVPNVSHETQERDEMTNNEVNNNVLLGGILIAHTPTANSPDIPESRKTDKCDPECKPSRNELCQKVDGAMRCICRPGFARMFPDRPCNPTYTYSVKITIDKIGKSMLHYNEKLANKNSTEFANLTKRTHESLDRMVMQSDVRDVYHGVQIRSFEPAVGNNGVTSRFYLQLSDNIDDSRLEDVFKKYLRSNNYSLGGTDVFASSQSIERLEAEDVDECTNPKFHDCSENAQCFNLKGTYTCSCKEGFSDLSENMQYPGRVCSAEQVGCERCNYHGTCYSRGGDETLCECFHWYAGESCHINLKVLLIALVTLGTILFALLLVCIILTCVRKKPRKSGMASGMSFLPQRVNNAGTLDRRAMIEDTSSEDSRSETNKTLPYVQKKQKKPKGALKKTSKVSMQATPIVEHTTVEPQHANVIFPDQKDRSLTVMIPRAKYHPAPPTSPLLNYTSFDARRPSVPSTTNEAKLLSYLDAGPSPSKSDPSRKYSNALSDSIAEAEKPSSRKTSGALVSAGFEVSATVVNNMGTLGTTCGTEADRSENATLIQKISADLLSSVDARSQFNTLRNSLIENDINPTSNWLDIPRVATVSESRSYDETTIPPAMKSLRGDYDSKSSQHNNDEANTMAERDLGSTFLLPHTHLYKPDRGSDISGFESL